MHPALAFFLSLLVIGLLYVPVETWWKNLRDRRELRYEQYDAIRRALAESRKFSGRAWDAADFAVADATATASPSAPTGLPGLTSAPGVLFDQQAGRGKSFGLTPAEGSTRADASTHSRGQLLATRDTAPLKSEQRGL